MLEINFTKHRPGFNLSVSTSFPPGITGIFGPSGAGKSTLLNCISGLLSPSEGIIKLENENLFQKPTINTPVHKRKIGYVFQNGRLFPHLKVKNNLVYSGRKKGHPINPNDFEKIVRTLEIQNLLEKYPSQLSGGEIQRVATGRALLMNPRALLMDEPFSALDKKLRKKLLPYISQLSKKLGIPVLVVSHDLQDLLGLTRTLCILKEGNVKAHKNYEDMLVSQDISDLLPSGDLINVVNLNVTEMDTSEGVVGLNGLGKECKVKITFEPGSMHYSLNQKVKVFLRPDDIVLATEPIGRTSFRNQIPGTIRHIVWEGPKVLCTVDCGFCLLARISRQAALQLGIKKGSHVYCLFKSLALDSMPA